MRSPDQNLTHIGQKIRERRKMFGFSQEHVADKAGINTCLVSYIENGRNCRLNTLLLILQVLELELTFT